MQAGGGGGNGLSKGGGLARFRSAPATWLEALLEDEENDVVVDPSPVLASTYKPPLPPPAGASSQQSESTEASSGSGKYAADLGLLDTVGSGAGGLSGLLRQNSSPAEFLSDGYFSSYGIPANYDYLVSSSSLDMSESPLKRPRETDSNAAKASSTVVKGEQVGGMSGLLDADLDKLAEDSVLCRVRAKRGCATHPRSIAERVRRTRISDRIRKLQELVPNMDKQTNTADMLEEAVEYVKFLQKQIQELTEQQKKCKCFTKE